MRRLALLISTTLLGLLGVVPIAAPAGAAPPYSLEERAAAIVSPSLVFLDFSLKGYLRLRASGGLVYESPVTIHSRCSGFVVGADGHVVTTTHCLRPSPEIMRGLASNALANQLIRTGQLKPDLKDDFINDTTREADFTGTTPDSPPVASVFAQRFLGTGDRSDAIVGRVVDSQPTTGSDVTLVKLLTKDLPVARVSASTPNPDTPVVLVGFAVANPAATSVTYTMRSQGERVVARYGAGSPPRYLLSGALGADSHGGMVVDTTTGDVIGMITADLVANDGGNRLVTDASQILGLLASSGVTNELTPTDQAYRAGLDAYFGGHYTEAIKNFDIVLAARADNLPAQTYRRSAVERRAIEGEPNPVAAIWTLVAAGVAILLMIVMAVVMFVRGRRLRARERGLAEYEPYPPLPAAPTSAVPISGVPTSPVPTPPVPMSGVHVPTAPAPLMPAVPVSGAPVSGVPAPPAPDPAAAVPAAATPSLEAPAPPDVPPPPMPTISESSAWPAMTLWRTPYPNDVVPPPQPAPDLSNDPPNADPR